MNMHIDITGVTLSTERLLLRPWLETDVKDMYEYAHADGVGQMAGWSPHKSLEESEQIIAMFRKGKRTLALEYGGKVIGSLGIDTYKESEFPQLGQLRGCEIGYVLSKDYWGQGLMPEAVKAVTQYLFDTVQVDFIVVGHFEWNKQSQSVIEKCGFQYVKTVPYETRFGTAESTKMYIQYRRHHYMEDFFSEDDEALVPGNALDLSH